MTAERQNTMFHHVTRPVQDAGPEHHPVPSWHGGDRKGSIPVSSPLAEMQQPPQAQQGAQFIAGAFQYKTTRHATPALLLHTLGQQTKPLSRLCIPAKQIGVSACAVIGRQGRDPAQNRLDKQSGFKAVQFTPLMHHSERTGNRNQDLPAGGKAGCCEIKHGGNREDRYAGKAAG